MNFPKLANQSEGTIVDSVLHKDTNQFKKQQTHYSMISEQTANNHKLSPFTWSNIKFPMVNEKSNNINVQNAHFNQKRKYKKEKLTLDIFNTLDSIQEKNKKKKSPQKINPKKVQKSKEKKSIDTVKHRQTILDIEVAAHKSDRVNTANKQKKFSFPNRNKSIQLNKSKQKPQKQAIGTLNKFQQIKKQLNRSLHTANCSLYTTNDQVKERRGRYSFKHQLKQKLHQQPVQYSKAYSHDRNLSEMEPYMKKVLLERNWFSTQNPKYNPMHQTAENEHMFCNQKTMIWTRNQKLSIFNQMGKGQFYNHIQGSHILTSKENLHELLSAYNHQFYPTSYSLPKEYPQFVQDYDWTLVKIVLKLVIQETDRIHTQTFSLMEQNDLSLCLANIIDDLTKQVSSPNLQYLKLCMFLQHMRKKLQLNQFFQGMTNYQQIDLNLPQSVVCTLIEWCMGVVKWQKTKQLQNLRLDEVDIRTLILLKNYDILFRNSLKGYLYSDLQSNNLWIGKPFASSRGAGIFLLNENSQFYTTHDYELKEYKLKSKYQNKIVQKYIDRPLLIPNPVSSLNPQSKNLTKTNINEVQQSFEGRKFDIRQWVLVISEPTLIPNKSKRKFSIYKYHSAYCRFAGETYSTDSKNLQTHLTNYQLFKQSNNGSIGYTRSLNSSINSGTTEKRKNFSEQQSVLMLEDLFQYFENQYTQYKQRRQPQEQNPQKQQLGKQELGSQGNEHIYRDIRAAYNRQIDDIILSTVKAASKSLHSHPRTFQLFGFDVILDERLNLYLLQVNLNPKCEHERCPKLKLQAQNMVTTLFQTIEDKHKIKGKQIKGHSIESSKSPKRKMREHMFPGEQYQCQHQDSLINKQRQQKQKQGMEQGQEYKQGNLQGKKSLQQSIRVSQAQSIVNENTGQSSSNKKSHSKQGWIQLC